MARGKGNLVKMGRCSISETIGYQVLMMTEMTRFRVQRKRAAGDNAAWAEFSSLPTHLGLWWARIAEEAGEDDASLESLTSWTGSEYQIPGHLAVVK